MLLNTMFSWIDSNHKKSYFTNAFSVLGALVIKLKLFLSLSDCVLICRNVVRVWFSHILTLPDSNHGNNQREQDMIKLKCLKEKVIKHYVRYALVSLSPSSFRLTLDLEAHTKICRLVYIKQRFFFPLCFFSPALKATLLLWATFLSQVHLAFGVVLWCICCVSIWYLGGSDVLFLGCDFLGPFDVSFWSPWWGSTPRLLFHD